LIAHASQYTLPDRRGARQIISLRALWVRRTTERQTPLSFATARFFLCIQYVLGSGRLGRAASSRSSAVHALRAARSRKSFPFLALREPAWSVSPLREASHEAVLYVRLVCSVMAGLGQRVRCLCQKKTLQRLVGLQSPPRMLSKRFVQNFRCFPPSS
jgi:hypothetical protein